MDPYFKHLVDLHLAAIQELREEANCDDELDHICMEIVSWAMKQEAMS